MIYSLERRHKGPNGFRMWRPIKESSNKEELEIEADRENANVDDPFEYTVTEKPE